MRGKIPKQHGQLRLDLRLSKSDQKFNHRADRRRRYLKNIRGERDKALKRVMGRPQNNARKRGWHLSKYATDELFKTKTILRRRIWSAFRRQDWTKKSSASLLIGCDWPTAKESKFKDGMSWSNHGEWEIDHVIPLAYAKTESHLIELLNYKNLQPLWASANRKKGANYVGR